MSCKSNLYFLAHGSVSVDDNTATVALYSNANGIFQCSLDEAPFQQCMATCIVLKYITYKSMLIFKYTSICLIIGIYKIMQGFPRMY